MREAREGLGEVNKKLPPQTGTRVTKSPAVPPRLPAHRRVTHSGTCSYPHVDNGERPRRRLLAAWATTRIAPTCFRHAAPEGFSARFACPVHTCPDSLGGWRTITQDCPYRPTRFHQRCYAWIMPQGEEASQAQKERKSRKDLWGLCPLRFAAGVLRKTPQVCLICAQQASPFMTSGRYNVSVTITVTLSGEKTTKPGADIADVEATDEPLTVTVQPMSLNMHSVTEPGL